MLVKRHYHDTAQGTDDSSQRTDPAEGPADITKPKAKEDIDQQIHRTLI